MVAFSLQQLLQLSVALDQVLPLHVSVGDNLIGSICAHLVHAVAHSAHVPQSVRVRGDVPIRSIHKIERLLRIVRDHAFLIRKRPVPQHHMASARLATVQLGTGTGAATLDGRGHLNLVMHVERLVEVILRLELFPDALGVEPLILHGHITLTNRYLIINFIFTT